MRYILSFVLLILNIVFIFVVEDFFNVGDPRAQALGFVYYMVWMSICMITSIAIFILSAKRKIWIKLMISLIGFGTIFIIQTSYLKIESDPSFNRMLLWGFLIVVFFNIIQSVCWGLLKKVKL